MTLVNRKPAIAAPGMTFVDHLEALRWHLVRSVVAVVVGAILIFIYAKEVASIVVLGLPGKILLPTVCCVTLAINYTWATIFAWAVVRLNSKAMP